MSTTANTGRATNWMAVTLTGILLVPLLGLAYASGAVGVTGLAVTALAVLGILAEVLTASDVRATCGSQGVSISWGAFGWPRMRYALDDIVDAAVIDIPRWAVSYGFWWTPFRTVCTVRTGPALRLRLRSGRRVTVTIPRPDQAVAAWKLARAEA